jgi:hypothetical protein
MADTKISALPASTTPLAGTEVLPIVQSGSTKQVSVANLTAGRDVSTANIVVSGITAGTGNKIFFDTTGEASSNNIGTVNDFNLRLLCGRGSSSSIDVASDSVRFAVGGVEGMRLNASNNLGVGTSSPSASAIVDVQSTTKGVRMPNMTTTQKNAIASPAAGLMVFDTTLAKLCVYSGAAWQTITSI